MTEGAGLRDDVAILVRELLARLEAEDMRELSVSRNGTRVRVRKATAETVAVAPAAPIEPDGAPADADPARRPMVVSAAPPTHDRLVSAPLTGVFYRSASPQAPAFVEPGADIAAGDVVGLIEAMKLFNEIRSTKSGRVRRVLAQNGQLVRAHQPLIELE
ncbi:MAG: acetyl-CoA carboxylase biotin carboxyl carrier protein [Chloroflexota bacterium]|nr:acetyl-CoA carboxylase biotin carboxyl carrier protein [Chloroflexota bacterium]